MTISTDDAAIQAGSNAARGQLDSVTSGTGNSGPAPGVHPLVLAAVDDSAAANRRAADRVRDGIGRTGKDSAGKTDIDRDGAGNLDQVGAAMLGALGAAGSALAGAAGGGGGAPQVPQLPSLAAPTAGNAAPAALSGLSPAQLVSRVLSGDGGGAVGTGGVLTAAGRGGGSGTAGPVGTGGTAYEQRVLSLARQVVGAGIPYAWGGGTLNGPSQGTRDGGAADAAGDYAKSGFDCSSLARFLVYQASGVEIPRTSEAQFAAGVTVSAAEARPGDLLFPASAGVPPSHVQVYVGEGKVVEAQQSGTNIMFSNAGAGTFKRYVQSV